MSVAFSLVAEESLRMRAERAALFPRRGPDDSWTAAEVLEALEALDEARQECDRLQGEANAKDDELSTLESERDGLQESLDNVRSDLKREQEMRETFIGEKLADVDAAVRLSLAGWPTALAAVTDILQRLTPDAPKPVVSAPTQKAKRGKR